jgi:DNA-binding transcriptional ArsR family regulator
MDMFVALADPTPRIILELLASSGELSTTALYEQFPLSPQAVSQHLKVLREAHFVELEKRAQKHGYHLNLQTLSQFRVCLLAITLACSRLRRSPDFLWL